MGGPLSWKPPFWNNRLGLLLALSMESSDQADDNIKYRPCKKRNQYHVTKTDISENYLANTQTLKACIKRLLYSRGFEFASPITKLCSKDLRTDRKALRCSSYFSEKLLGSSMIGRWISSCGIDLGNIQLFQNFESILDGFLGAEIHSNGCSAEYERGMAHDSML